MTPKRAQLIPRPCWFAASEHECTLLARGIVTRRVRAVAKRLAYGPIDRLMGRRPPRALARPRSRKGKS